MAAGRRSKVSLTAWAIFSGSTTSVPNVSTMRETGWATPMA